MMRREPIDTPRSSVLTSIMECTRLKVPAKPVLVLCCVYRDDRETDLFRRKRIYSIERSLLYA
jgi:hypothetical protein